MKRIDMKLRAKFILAIGLVLLFSFGITFYKTALFQDQLVISYAERQARMLARQIVLTRKWVADHNGLFFLKGPGVEANTFLSDPEIKDSSGRILVKRNPAMVTRELSAYSTGSDFCSFKVTSLEPINPENKPDPFEEESLLQFKQGVQEVVAVTKGKKGRVLRFIMPLEVQESCLECHMEQGYQQGDIRGGLSLTVPMDWADSAIKKNNKLLMLIVLSSIFFVGLILYFLIDLLVVRRLLKLSIAMDKLTPEDISVIEISSSSDEIGSLSKKFTNLGKRLVKSISDLEQTKEQFYQSEKMASLGRLSAGIAHEINNPLGGMRNCVKSMKESPDNKDLIKRYTDLLDKGLVRVEQTMRQLLNFGRKEPLRLQKIDINETIKECFGLIKYRMENIELTWDLMLQGPWLVDVEALRQIVVNIALNAIQALPGGGVIKVETYELPTTLVISIADTGAGIPDNDIRKIFDPFFTTKDVGKGTGLGLSVSYALAERMCGTIAVESKEGEGSCFRITLPKITEEGDNSDG